MSINSPKQLKDWLRNKEKKDGIPANTLINYYMMEEIMSVELDDHVVFQLNDIKNIHEEGQYEDFRMTIEAQFFTMRVKLKVDLTTGDVITPREIDYNFKLMFEDRSISVKAYNLQTILAEKIESILARNISNTRARDYYDIYALLKMKKSEVLSSDLREALQKKTQERHTGNYLEQYFVYLQQIQISPELHQVWRAYQKQYSYAADISFEAIVSLLWETLDAMNIR